jgi:hypothetical protein
MELRPVNLDDQHERRPGLSDPRNAEARPADLEHNPVTVAEESGRAGTVTGKGVEE